MTRYLAPISILVLSASLAACGDPEPTAEEKAAAERAATEAEIAAAEQEEVEREQAVASNESLSEAQEFLDQVAQDGSIQIGMAKILKEKASREDLKTFADSAIDFHQQTLISLRDLAEQNDNLELETVLSEEQERNFAQLRGARSVDDMFLERTRASYREIDGVLADYAENGDFEALKSWAEAARERFKAHRDELAKL